MQIEIFSKVKDPRDLGKVKHELEDVLRITEPHAKVATVAKQLPKFW